MIILFPKAHLTIFRDTPECRGTAAAEEKQDNGQNHRQAQAWFKYSRKNMNVTTQCYGSENNPFRADSHHRSGHVPLTVRSLYTVQYCLMHFIASIHTDRQKIYKIYFQYKAYKYLFLIQK